MTNLPDINEIGVGQPSEQPFVKLIFACVCSIHAKNAVEIGTGIGTFSLAVLKGLEETGGRLTSCDPVQRQKIVHPQFVYHKKKSNEMLSLLKTKIDFLLIDGDHTFPQVLDDVLNYLPKCRPGCLLALHDICVSKFPGISYIWDILKRHFRIVADFQAFPGMGVVEVHSYNKNIFDQFKG
jgi:predicted O-methyltransferase YrrM